MEPYLVTCQEGAEIFNYYMHGRKYLCHELDKYSITDLVEFKDETLEGTIKTCLTLGRKHIGECQRCKLKGFFCEICNSNELIFPFETETTVTCPTCYSCFHKSCFKNPENCPKCKRISQRRLQAREDSS